MLTTSIYSLISDIACFVAVSYLYGINTPPNFKQPFKAKILKISGIDGICHYHSGLEIVFICVHYSICHVKNI